MGGIIIWKYCALLALSSSPVVPLALAWSRLRKDDHPRKFYAFIPIVIVSLSLLWFDAAIMNYRFLGPLYGELHYAITGGNLLVVLVCGLVSLLSAIRKGAWVARVATTLASLMIAAEWIFLGITNR
jgi:hypothetical protein